MLIANTKRKENIAEYLLYMWQIEDIIRAYQFNIEAIKESIINKYEQPEDVKKGITEWYEGLIDMMKQEGIEKEGHLQVNKNVIINLTDLHNALLSSPKEQEYINSYYKTLPFIVELRNKGVDKNEPEIETCFSALYGFLLLKMQHKEVSGETQAAISQISSLLRLLAYKYKQDKDGLLELD